MNTRPLSVGIIGSLLASVFASGIGMAPSAQRDLAPPALPQTTTPVCGNIGANTNWTVANSPYEVCLAGVTVMPTITLTIEPGVTVQFAQGGGNKLNVNYGGTLTAIGTLTQPITFTGVVATPGSWGGISALATLTPSRVSLSYVTLEYGGINATSGAQVYAYNAVLTITNSLIRNGNGNGVLVESNSPKIDIRDTGFLSNTRSAILLNQPSHRDLTMSGLSASANGVNGVTVEGSTTLSGQRRWANTGIPYVVNGPILNGAGDGFTIDPGSELQFGAAGMLNISGKLNAIGLPNAPITLTGRVMTPGSWPGLAVHGAVIDQASAELDYATIEYGGSLSGGANIVVGLGGQLVVRHSLIRFSAKDGVRNDVSTSGISLLNSQIVSNTLYGVRNQFPTSAILASNTWWGDPNGPTTDTPACSIGTGDKVTNGVIFRPVLTDALTTRPFPLSNAPILTMSPRRWFAPADGITKVYFDLTLRDSDGAPLAGRVTRLTASLGTVTDGGITDLNGKASAYLVSTNVGEVNVRATLDGLAACENALSPKARVTFNPPLNITELFPNSPASYFSEDISITPMPVIVGITATIHTKLTNPLSVPITVDVAFGYAQSSIGLAFGPISDIVGQVIPPSSSLSLAATFMPMVSGHFCVEVSYSISAIGFSQLALPEGSYAARQRFNASGKPGSMGTPSDKAVLERADKAFNAVSKLPSTGTHVQKAIIGRGWGWLKNTALGIAIGLGSDPPRQDYNQATLPVFHAWPATIPSPGVSITRANAMNAATDALATVDGYGVAATTALDRYGGASEASNLEWAAQQANARIFYQEKMGEALLIYASALEDFALVLVTEGETGLTVSVGDVISYQLALSSTGFTVQEIADAHLLGLSDADIETYRQGILAANPDDLAGDLLLIYADEAAISREWGRAMLAPSAYDGGISISGSPGLKPSTTTSNSLAQINTIEDSFVLGNPLTATALIDLRARRIDLPADWMVNVTPAQVSLAPGEQTTVTVSIVPGSPTPQGTIPRLAVEGYAGSQLLGGVAINIVVPAYIDFAPYHAYGPMISR